MVNGIKGFFRNLEINRLHYVPFREYSRCFQGEPGEPYKWNDLHESQIGIHLKCCTFLGSCIVYYT